MPRSIIMREIKTLRKWPKKRKMGQMHQTEGPVTDMQVYGQVTFMTKVKLLCHRERKVFNKWYWVNQLYEKNES